MTRNDVNIDNVLDVPLPKIESPLSDSSTYTTLFMLPAFDIFVDEILYNMFVNAYIDDNGLKHVYQNTLFFLTCVKDMRTIGFVTRDQYLRQNPNYRYSYIVGKHKGAYLIMYVFECPERYISDYYKYLDSKYSYFSKEYKRLFTQSVPTIYGEIIESPIYSVLHKSPSFKHKMEELIGEEIDPDSEIFGAIKKEYEIFRYKKN